MNPAPIYITWKQTLYVNDYIKQIPIYILNQ